MSKQTKVSTLLSSNSRGGTITIKHIEQPHGEFSDPIITIELKENNISIIELPAKDIDEIIEALWKAKKINKNVKTFDAHPDSGIGTGGGE